MKNKKTSTLGLALGAAVLLCGCVGDMLSPKPDPTSFYRLSTTSSGADASLKSSISAIIMPISIPSYMDRTQIVTLGDGNRVNIAEFQRWIEPPAASFSRVLCENIRALSGNSSISAYPAVAFTDKYFWVRVYIHECIGGLGEELAFKSRWQLVDVNGKDELVSKAFEKSYPTAGSFDSYVGAISLACEDLAREIAKGISEFEGKAASAGAEK